METQQTETTLPRENDVETNLRREYKCHEDSSDKCDERCAREHHYKDRAMKVAHNIKEKSSELAENIREKGSEMLDKTKKVFHRGEKEHDIEKADDSEEGRIGVLRYTAL